MSDLSPECSPKRTSVDHFDLSVRFSLQLENFKEMSVSAKALLSAIEVAIAELKAQLK